MTRLLLLTVIFSFMIAAPLPAQDCCMPCGQEYRLVCQTIYEEQPVTTRRLAYETIVEQQQVVSYRPVWETTTRERKYTVSKPVVETSSKEERRTVMRPVREVRYRDESYTRTSYVAETSSKEERRTVMRPVVETQTRQEKRVVQRPVVETVMQDQVTTAYRPVTNVYQRYVDQGQTVDQTQYVPGETRHRLQWKKSQCMSNPATGETSVLRAGFYWVPKQKAGTYQVNRVYVPNPVLQQKTETSYVPEQVRQKVPVNVTRMQSELQVREVPVQVVRMEPEEQVRTVPVTVQRPVTETIPRYVPEYRCRYVPEVQVRTVPVKTYKYVTEERTEQIPVRTCKMVKEIRNVEVPRTQAHWVTETSTRTVARQVWVKIPIDNGCSLSSIPVEDLSIAMNSTPVSVVTNYPANIDESASPSSESQNAVSSPGPTESEQTGETPNDENSPPVGTPPVLEFSLTK